ncbi:DNA topoisomerase IB [Noviherbaspirillum sp. CPCC 100848]|uniref:DNA topoisomerase n=1 Tax=Noviherbaspirillum album TaxID=3080276 RepID=A0ABU6JIC3_9BURK|nr:DNA topoisomerase IB [Noviherbaspirillum sp. CPCC 100848]MEC4723216.1 DNA topoisomerase IB [Noviherbaspirillum sp. CPCC 100848]
MTTATPTLRTSSQDSSPESPQLARQIGLRYVTDSIPGFTRQAWRDGFRYLDTEGRPIRDDSVLARIRSLVIPPAWTEVWICPWENGHLQATGRDARKRKQYRYHPRWRNVRDEAKYGRMISFGQALPAIRAQVDKDLKLPGLPREKMLATIVYLLEATMMRIGNEQYAKQNKSFGLTTLRDRHVRIDGGEVEFRFRGKSGVQHAIKVGDARLARIIRRTRDLPGQELFQYIDDDGQQRSIGSADVNDYLRAITGEDYTAKDFRTWSGTVLAALALQEYERFDSDAQAKKNVVRAIESVAEKLGNTPSICRKCYVHPAVIESYLDGTMLQALQQRAQQELQEDLHALGPEEAAVVALLQQRLQASADGARTRKSKPPPKPKAVPKAKAATSNRARTRAGEARPVRTVGKMQ